MEGFEFKEGTLIKAGAQAAAGLWATGQAINAQAKYKEKLKQIEDFERQELINPYQNLSNPFANLSVATKAAEMQIEQTDIALANTLDNLRATGTMAGGATALAQAALMSKQGVASSIEKQEVQNQRLAAQGQLQVDLYKGQGELNRMKMQETREKQELDRLQAQADQQLQQRISSTTSAFNALGDVGSTLAAGLVPSKLPETQDPDLLKYTGDEWDNWDMTNINSPTAPKKMSGFMGPTGNEVFDVLKTMKGSMSASDYDALIDELKAENIGVDMQGNIIQGGGFNPFLSGAGKANPDNLAIRLRK